MFADELRSEVDNLTLLMPRKADSPLAWDALALMEEDLKRGSKSTPVGTWAKHAIEYDPNADMHFDLVKFVSWRQQAAPDDIEQNELWSDFLPTQVSWGNGGRAGLTSDSLLAPQFSARHGPVARTGYANASCSRNQAATAARRLSFSVGGCLTGDVAPRVF